MADKAVTVLGGYLGSGKTTLLNRLLAASTEPVIVLVNDFGDITVDRDLIVGAAGDTMELANGCICCSMADGFVDALDAIAPLAPSRVVVEASGVADPAAAAAYAHRPGFRLDGIVVTADAADIRRRATDTYVGDVVVAQLRSADLVVATKTDLADAEPTDELRAWIHQTSEVPVVDGAEIDPTVLFDATAADDPPTPAQLAKPFHTGGVDLGPVDRDRLRRALEDRPELVVRAKGVLTDTDGQRITVQVVGRRVDIGPGPSGAASPNRLVAIGVGDIDLAGWLADLAVEVS